MLRVVQPILALQCNVSMPTLDKFKDESIGYSTGILDSGASVHLCGNKSMFVGKLRSVKINIKCANNDMMIAEWQGDVEIMVAGKLVLLHDALFLDGAPMLISVARLVKDKKLGITFWGNECSIFDDNKKVFLTIKNGLYGSDCLFLLPFGYSSVSKKFEIMNYFVNEDKTIEEVAHIAINVMAKPKFDKITMKLIHERYNHVNKNYCKLLGEKHANGAVSGQLCWCDACVVGGLNKKKYAKKTSRHLADGESNPPAEVEPNVVQVNNIEHNNVQVEHEPVQVCPLDHKSVQVSPLDHDFVQVCKVEPKLVQVSKIEHKLVQEIDRKYGQVEEANFVYKGIPSSAYGQSLACDTKVASIASVRGYKYGFVVLCKKTRMTLALLGKHKDEFVTKMTVWLEQYKNRYGKYPADIHFDRGGEFTSNKFANDLQEKGINITFSGTQEHNQNPQVERKIGIIWMALLKVLAHSGVPFQFWCYAFEYVTIVSNHIPSRALKGKSPIEVACLNAMHNFIHVFGCEVGYVDPSRLGHEAVGRRGVFLGIDPEIKGYRILDILTRAVVVSRNMVANEHSMPFIHVLKPCLIMLKFGTWPTAALSDFENKTIKEAQDRVMETEVAAMRNGGDSQHLVPHEQN